MLGALKIKVLISVLIIVTFFYTTFKFREEQQDKINRTELFMSEGERFTKFRGDLLEERISALEEQVKELSK